MIRLSVLCVAHEAKKYWIVQIIVSFISIVFRVKCDTFWADVNARLNKNDVEDSSILRKPDLN